MLGKPAIAPASCRLASSIRRKYQNKLVSSRIVLALLEHAADFKNKLGGSLFLKQLGVRPGCASSYPRVRVLDIERLGPRGPSLSMAHFYDCARTYFQQNV